LKAALTWRVSASCSAGNAGRKSAVTFRIAPGGSLDGSGHRAHEGLENRIIPGEVVLSLTGAWGPAERGVLSSLFSYGQKDYYLGDIRFGNYSEVAYRITKQPFITGGLALGLGVLLGFSATCTSADFPRAHGFPRKEQMAKLRAIFKSLVRFKRVDNLHTGAKLGVMRL